LKAGVYIYKLTVTDNRGATSSDQITVTVNSAKTSEQPAILHTEVVQPEPESAVQDIPTPTTGIDSLLLYPNPARGLTNLRLSGVSTGKAIITVCDISGRVIWKSELNKTAQTLDAPLHTEGLAQGVYIIGVSIGTHLKLTAVFMKQ
jgi:hypothetical protein